MSIVFRLFFNDTSLKVLASKIFLGTRNLSSTILHDSCTAIAVRANKTDIILCLAGYLSGK